MLKIEYKNISELIPYSKNPRKNDKAVEIVANSIKEFGFLNPIILDKNNEIIAGHTRLKAAHKLNITQIPIIYVDNLTPEQVKAFRIMDNKSSEYSLWDEELLQSEIESLKGLNFDLVFTGFDEHEIDKLLGFEEIEEKEIDLAKPKYDIKQGDIIGYFWRIRKHIDCM